MEKMKYKIGQQVRIKSLDWYEKNKTNGVVELIDNDDRGYNFIEAMSAYCGRVMTITNVIISDCSSYEMVEDNKAYFWTDDMIESEVEKEEKLPTEPRKNFITADRKTAKDVDLVEDMFSKGYQLSHIVPRFYNDGSPIGYTYWFESLDLIK